MSARMCSLGIVTTLLISLFIGLSVIPITVSASITGDAYSGSGNWVITQATVYTGETLTVYGTIYINTSGSLTLLNTHLTMDEATSGYAHTIWANNGWLSIGTGSVINTTNATAGTPNCKIYNSNYKPIYISNATLTNCYVQLLSSTTNAADYLDNTTLISSQYTLLTGRYVNITNNHFRDYSGPNQLFISGGNAEIRNNLFTNITNNISSGVLKCGAIVMYGVDGGRNAVIRNNNLDYTVLYQGITLYNSWGTRVTENRIENVSRNAADSSAGGVACFYDGYGNVTIDNNTIEMVYGPLVSSLPAYGIWGHYSSTDYVIENNTIWNVKKNSNFTYSHGIAWEGDDTTIHNNRIINVTGTYDVGGCPCGIFAGGYQGGLGLQQTGMDVHHNIIDSIDQVANGISIGSVADGNVETGATVCANRVERVNMLSIGVGIYSNVRNTTVCLNTVNNVSRDSCGLRFADNVSYQLVYQNVVSVIDYSTMVPGNTNGAISMPAEGTYTNMQFSYVYDNLIVIADQDSDDYPEYNVSYCYQGTPVVIIQNGSYIVGLQKSVFNVRGYTNMPLLTDITGSPTYFLVSTYWNREFSYITDTNYHIVQVATTGMQVISSATINMTIWSLLPDASTTPATWSVTADSGTCTYTLTGLDSTVGYKVYVDGEEYYQQLEGFATITFSYDGPWSEHTFELVSWEPQPSSGPMAYFSYTLNGGLLTCTDYSYNGAVRWVWNFGDGYGSTDQNPTHRYIKSGKYVLSLTVFDSEGRSSLATTQIEVVFGEDMPVERNDDGWNLWVSDELTLGISAAGLIVSGGILFFTGMYVKSLPIITPKGRKVLGILMVLFGLYFFIFVDNNWLG